MGEPGSRVVLADGSFAVLADGSFAVFNAAGECPECCGPCSCRAGSFRVRACVDFHGLITFGRGIEVNGIPCGSIELSLDFGNHFDCIDFCPDLPVGGALIDDVTVPASSQYALPSGANWTAGATVTIVKTAGRGSVTFSAGTVSIDDEEPAGPDCYDFTVSWTCP